MSIAESEPLIGSEEIPQDDVGEGEDVQYILEGNFSERVAEHPLENIDIDRLLVERLGEFGWYQKISYLLVCLPAALTAGITLGSVFTEYVPLHRCFIAGCDDQEAARYDDAALLGFDNFTEPSSFQCQSYQRLNNKSSCSASDFDQTSTEGCGRYLFEDTVVKSSIVSEYGLVCDKDWQVPLSQSVFFAGVLVGAITFGWLSDVIGRKKTFLICLMETLICGTLAALSIDMDMFMVAQFFTAMGQVGLFQTTFVLGVELVGPSKRVLCGVVIEYFFVAGELYLALTAWYFRQWRRIQLANVLPGILFLSYIVVLPESVRWLITNKKFPEALKTLETVAKRNDVELPSERDLLSFKKRSEASQQTSESMTDLLRRPVLACRLLIVFLCWFVITMIYYGLSMNASSLAGDVYVNFALLSLCEIPGYTLSYVGMSWLGRKASLSSSL